MTDLQPVQYEIQAIIDWDVWKRDCIPRLKYASKLEIPHLPQLLPHTGKCAIVGAGPSVRGYVDQIKAIKEAHEFNTVMTVNGAHEWLIGHGIKPKIHVIFENDLKDVRTALGGEPEEGIAYYICSHCSQGIFKQLEGYHRVLWHAFCPPQSYQQAIARYFRGEFMIGGGYATFFRTLSIAMILGYCDFELFGLDSSFEGSSHLDGYAIADREPQVSVFGADPTHQRLKRFKTQGGLAFQASEFIEFCRAHQADLRLRIHGDGLLRYVHEARYPEQYTEGT